ncbi:MAG: hypothetical protein M5U19_03150 [Microthrixaceae bacterium]|nr:hypothetical protein [Microthrixaceae bacterium]
MRAATDSTTTSAACPPSRGEQWQQVQQRERRREDARQEQQPVGCHVEQPARELCSPDGRHHPVLRDLAVGHRPGVVVRSEGQPAETLERPRGDLGGPAEPGTHRVDGTHTRLGHGEGREQHDGDREVDGHAGEDHRQAVSCVRRPGR